MLGMDILKIFHDDLHHSVSRLLILLIIPRHNLNFFCRLLIVWGENGEDIFLIR